MADGADPRSPSIDALEGWEGAAVRPTANPERRGVRQRDLAGVALGNGAARVQSVNCGIA